MSVYIISDESQFIRTVRSSLRRLGDQRDVHCLFEAVWEEMDQSLVAPDSLLIADSRNAAFSQTISPEAFAVVRHISQHTGEATAEWEELSLEALMLRLHQDALKTSPCPGVEIRVMLESPWFKERSILMSSRPSTIPVVRDLLWDSAYQAGSLQSDCASRFCVSVGEALANAVFHGNLQLCSSLKEGQGSEFTREAAIRQSQEPFKDRRVRVTETTSCFGVWITIADEGAGFDPQETIRHSSNPGQLLSSGRGLLMMQGLTDELFFNEAGTEVTLVFYSAQNQRNHPAARPTASTTICKSPAELIGS